MKTIWRKITRISSDGIKSTDMFMSSNDYLSDLEKAKKECKSKSVRLAYLSKTTYDTFGNKL